MNIDSFPLTNLGDEGFRLYYSIFLWITGVISGLGSEVFVCLLYLRSWCPERELWWRYVQLLFPLIVTPAVGLASQRNFLALTFAVIGLWKFGFPETVMYVFVGFMDTKASKLLRTADVLNGLGTIIHHSIVVWYVTLQLGGIFVVDRYILSAALVPLMQHWFVLLAYANANLYTAVMLSLEVYFEWTIFAYMDHFYNNHGLSVAIIGGVMVLAHWFYLIAAAIEMFVPELEQDEEDDAISVSTNNTLFRNVHTRGVQVFVRRNSGDELSDKEITMMSRKRSLSTGALTRDIRTLSFGPPNDDADDYHNPPATENTSDSQSNSNNEEKTTTSTVPLCFTSVSCSRSRLFRSKTPKCYKGPSIAPRKQ